MNAASYIREIIVFLLLPLALVRAQDAEPITADGIRLNGIVFFGSTQIVLITDLKTSQTSWLSPNERVAGMKLKEIKRGSVIVSSETDNREQEVFIGGTTGKARKGPPVFSKAWINSRENPMVFQRISLPLEMNTLWDDMTREEKENFVQFYRNHGWQLAQVDQIGGAVAMVWEDIYGDERRAIRNARYRKFVDSLDENQKKKREQSMGVNRLGQLTPETSQQDAAVLKHQLEQSHRLWREFLDSLRPDQKAQYESVGDFTTADWSK